MYKIKVFREAKGWSQAELGERVGVTGPAISQYETGARSPDIAMLRKLAFVLDTDLNTLAGDTMA